jgi:3-hydroxyisobutyrate dehydrogenase-like beta-hydroxyacid dehydrogenase
MSSPESVRVGFLGLGIMGSRMAATIGRAGFPLNVWTHTAGKAAAWAGEHGADAYATPAEVAAASEIVISMVVDADQVASVLLGDDGLVAGAQAGLVAVDCSTIGPAAARSIGGRLRERGVALLDAPVTGSAPRAQDGTLTIMVGGEPSGFARALPVLQAVGRLVVHVGDLGQGQMLKLINNALAAANASALAEALLLARAAGLSLDDFEAVVGSGSGDSAQLQTKAAAMRDHDFRALFKTAHMLKDVRLCLDEAQAAGVPFAAAAHARDLLTASMARGRGDDDYAALVEAVEGLAAQNL